MLPSSHEYGCLGTCHFLQVLAFLKLFNRWGRSSFSAASVP
jgi:hypothetical protein